MFFPVGKNSREITGDYSGFDKVKAFNRDIDLSEIFGERECGAPCCAVVFEQSDLTFCFGAVSAYPDGEGVEFFKVAAARGQLFGEGVSA